MPMKQRTLILLKPDAVARGLMGKILDRFEMRGFRIVAMKLLQVTPRLAATHYAEHKGKPFYPTLIRFITSGPLLAMAVEGNEVVSACRRMMGTTFCPEADPGSIRGDFGLSRTQNLIHGSDSVKSAKRELALFFKKDDYVKYPLEDFKWVYNMKRGEPI